MKDRVKEAIILGGILWIKKQVSMTRKYHNDRSQTNPRCHEEEDSNNWLEFTSGVENSVGPDQLAVSGSTLFSKQDLSGFRVARVKSFKVVQKSGFVK